MKINKKFQTWSMELLMFTGNLSQLHWKRCFQHLEIFKSYLHLTLGPGRQVSSETYVRTPQFPFPCVHPLPTYGGTTGKKHPWFVNLRWWLVGKVKQWHAIEWGDKIQQHCEYKHSTISLLKHIVHQRIQFVILSRKELKALLGNWEDNASNFDHVFFYLTIPSTLTQILLELRERINSAPASLK